MLWLRVDYSTQETAVVVRSAKLAIVVVAWFGAVVVADYAPAVGVLNCLIVTLITIVHFVLLT